MGKVNSGKKLNINGNEYKYTLNLNAMINFEEETGKSLMDMSEEDNFSMKDLRAMLWAGLNENHDVNVKEVGSWLHPGNMNEIANKIMELYEDVTPEQEGGTGKP